MRRLPFLQLCMLLLLACDSGQTTTNPTEPEEADEQLGEGRLDGQGPGGIGGITARMVEPQIAEAEALLAEGEYQRALETIEAAIADKPNHARFHYVRGNALSYLDRDAEARAAYERAIALDDTDALPHAGIGNLIAFQHNATLADRRESIPHFQAALKLDPKLASAHQALGVVLLSLGQVKEAIEALETADRLAPNVETAYSLAQAHGQLGNDEKALAHAKRAVEYEPEQSGVDVRLLYARLLHKSGRTQEAAREYEQAAKLAPDSGPLRLEVARGLLELGDPDAAMLHMQWLLAAAPGQAPVLVNYGRILVAQNKPSEALVQFDQALQLDRSSQAAHTYKIEALVAAKRCKEARAQWDALAALLGWGQASGEPMPRALSKAQGFLAAGKCK